MVKVIRKSWYAETPATVRWTMSVWTWLDDSKLRTRMPNCAPGTAGFAPVIVFWVKEGRNPGE